MYLAIGTFLVKFGPLNIDRGFALDLIVGYLPLAANLIFALLNLAVIAYVSVRYNYRTRIGKVGMSLLFVILVASYVWVYFNLERVIFFAFFPAMVIAT